jgi:hypothetical protein
MEGRLHLLGRKKNLPAASECFIQALDQFILRLQSSSIEEFNSSVFEYFAYFFRVNKEASISKYFWQRCEKLRSIAVRLRINEISDFDMEKLQLFYKMQSPVSFYHDSKFDFPIIG